MSLTKPGKPDLKLPVSFGGVKTPFSEKKTRDGYQENIPDILAGDNLNFLLDCEGANQDYLRKIVDYIRDTPIGKILTANKDNQLDYLGLDESLAIINGLICVSALVGMSKFKKMTGAIIQPDPIYTIIEKDLSASAVLTFDNSLISGLPDDVAVTNELHLNMPTVVPFNFSPQLIWEGGETPDFSEAGQYWIVIRTTDKGVTWYASLGSVFSAKAIVS